MPVSSTMVTIPPLLMWRVGRVMAGGKKWYEGEGIARGSKGNDPSPSVSFLLCVLDTTGSSINLQPVIDCSLGLSLLVVC